jgi:hypothetical protein
MFFARKLASKTGFSYIVSVRLSVCKQSHYTQRLEMISLQLKPPNSGSNTERYGEL